MSFAWPLFLGTMAMSVGQSDFNPPEYSKWKQWQLIQAKNWQAQALGYRESVMSCDLECSKGPINKPENILEVPLVSILAPNEAVKCSDKKLENGSLECKRYNIDVEVSKQINSEYKSLGRPWGEAEACGEGPCEHNFPY